jgi:hypothetical protein
MYCYQISGKISYFSKDKTLLTYHGIGIDRSQTSDVQCTLDFGSVTCKRILKVETELKNQDYFF